MTIPMVEISMVRKEIHEELTKMIKKLEGLGMNDELMVILEAKRNLIMQAAQRDYFGPKQPK